MSPRRRKELLDRGIEVVEAEFMLQKLLSLLRKSQIKRRKTVHLEPLLWLLQTLDKMEKPRLKPL